MGKTTDYTLNDPRGQAGMRYSIGHEDRETNSPQQTIEFNFAGNLHGFTTLFKNLHLTLNDFRAISPDP